MMLIPVLAAKLCLKIYQRQCFIKDFMTQSLKHTGEDRPFASSVCFSRSHHLSLGVGTLYVASAMSTYWAKNLKETEFTNTVKPRRIELLLRLHPRQINLTRASKRHTQPNVVILR